jgi:uncharacterized membrane protein YdbT with pleckstrin-like domain
MIDPYVKSLLGEKESVLRITRQHWSALVERILPEIILIIVILVVTSVLVVTMPGTPAGFGYALLILPLISLVRDVLIWKNHQYVVTSRRIIQVFGVFNKNVTDSSLEKVNDVKMEQAFLGRLFDYGDIEILTASELGMDRFTRISKPILFKTTMLNAKNRLESDGNGSLRAAAPMDIPALLNELGRLHHQGILTDAEFQQKKAELLKKI